MLNWCFTWNLCLLTPESDWGLVTLTSSARMPGGWSRKWRPTILPPSSVILFCSSPGGNVKNASFVGTKIVASLVSLIFWHKSGNFLRYLENSVNLHWKKYAWKPFFYYFFVNSNLHCIFYAKMFIESVCHDNQWLVNEVNNPILNRNICLHNIGLHCSSPVLLCASHCFRLHNWSWV